MPSGHRPPDRQEGVALRRREGAEQVEPKLLLDAESRGRCRRREQVGGRAAERRRQPRHPVQGELALAALEVADLLGGGVDQLGEAGLGQPPLAPDLPDAVGRPGRHVAAARSASAHSASAMRAVRTTRPARAPRAGVTRKSWNCARSDRPPQPENRGDGVPSSSVKLRRPSPFAAGTSSCSGTGANATVSPGRDARSTPRSPGSHGSSSTNELQIAVNGCFIVKRPCASTAGS